MSKTQIQHMGNLLPLDKNGFIVSLSSKDKILEPWAGAVEAARVACLEHFGDRVHSMYVRGSVARGNAIAGISDVDAFAVLSGGVHDEDESWAEKFQRGARSKFPFAQKVEIELIPYSELMSLESDEYMFDRFMIKAQSACIYGVDLAPKLPGFKPNKSLAANAYAFDELRSKLRSSLSETEDSSEIKDWCTWIMKRFLRTGFEMVMEEEQAYTRDLYLCYKIFSKYYPERESDMRQVLELALNPASDKSVVLGVVDGFGRWISEEAIRKFPR